MQALRGFNDYFGTEAEKFNKVISVASMVAKVYGFQSLILPILEQSSLFERNLGQDTDIVSKEIYKFEDKSSDLVAMRPEFTAGVVRALCEHGDLRSQKSWIKLFSHGPLFRYERPQSGRYRQFNQVNFEFFGDNSLYSDAIIIKICNDLINILGIKNTECEVNFIGGLECKSRYIEYLNEYFSKYKDDLSENSRVRLESKKALRILDSKDEGDKKICQAAKSIENFYNNESRKRIDDLYEIWNSVGMKIKKNSNLVRGLDYYTDLVFEFTSFDLKSKSQKALLGGGRYDNLVSDISRNKINLPAVGFAGGIERLMQVMQVDLDTGNKIAILPMSNDLIGECISLQSKLMQDAQFTGWIVDILLCSSVSKGVGKSLTMGFSHFIVLGENEIIKKSVQIKNMIETDGKNIIEYKIQ